MSSTITTSVTQGGTNSHATTSAEANAVATDFVTQGAVGTLGNTTGVSPATGSFAVNAQGTPAMLVDITAGSAYIAATPTGQVAQVLRATMTANYTGYAISANSSGTTKYDWIYLKVDPDNANNPSGGADNVSALYTSRSSSNTADNGSPPTYGIKLAIVTVANGASSISNGNIADNRSQSSLSVSGDSGTSLQTIRGEEFFDYVASGCVWSPDSAGSTLNGSMTAGVVYIGGRRLSASAVSAHAFTASKDTYIDIDNSGVLHYTEVANNAASPSLSTNFLRLAIVVSGSTSIAASTSINQGQETRVLPIASSVPYAVTDSNGNLICPRDPNRKLLGYRQITSNATNASTTQTAVTGLSLTVLIPTGRKIKITAKCRDLLSTTTNSPAFLGIWDGTPGSGTQLDAGLGFQAGGSGSSVGYSEVITTPSTASKTYAVGLSATAGTGTIDAAATYPAYLKVELE